MQVITRLAFVLLSAPGVTGCDPYACLYETRFVATTPNGKGFSGYVNFRDYSVANPPASLAWSIAITPASPTPTAIVIADRRDGSVLANVPIQQTTGVISGSGLDFTTKADRNRTFDVLTSGNGVLIVTVPNQTSPVTIPLLVTEREDWHHGTCS